MDETTLTTADLPPDMVLPSIRVQAEEARRRVATEAGVRAVPPLTPA